MGYPMARNLIRAGHDVALWSHSGGKASQLVAEAGGQAYDSPKQVAEQSDCMFLCVGDTSMSEQVTVGPSGIIEGAKPGSVVADASTIAPHTSKQIGEKLAARQVHFLDAPCTGSKPGAEKATLTFMVGGDREVFDKTKPFLEAMGKQFYYCGESGKGLQAKLTQNLILANIMQAFNEGMVLSTKGGIDPKLMLEILDNSAAKSGLISFKAPYVMRRDFSTNFSTKWMHKDISLALEAAQELDVPLPLTGLTQQMFRAAIAMGYGDDDMCSTVRVVEQWAHTEVRE